MNYCLLFIFNIKFFRMHKKYYWSKVYVLVIVNSMKNFLENLGRSWAVLDNLGRSWTVLDGLGQSWTVLNSLGHSWTILECLQLLAWTTYISLSDSKLSKIVQHRPRLSKNVQDCPRVFKIVQDHPRIANIVHDCPRPYTELVEKLWRQK